MIQLELSFQSMMLVLGAAYIFNLFAAWSIHFILHRRILGIPFDIIHYNAHHFPANKSALERRNWAILEHGVWATLVVLYFCIYLSLFCPWIACVYILQGLVCVVATYLLHAEYERSQSWLKRYAWFERGKNLHKFHHSFCCLETFARSKNYAFGGPISHNFLDRVFGTFQDCDRPSISVD